MVFDGKGIGMEDALIFKIDIHKKFLKTNRFRQSAIHFEEYGCYTKHARGTISYRYFWDEEIKRCLKGYTIDGVTITGYHYFYLNYSPIWQAIKEEDENSVKGKKGKGVRKFSFPRFYDGDYWWFHYIEEARKNGLQGSCLKSRRKGYSWKAASMLNRNYFLIPGSKSYAIAQEESDLIKDGLLTKAWEQMDFIDKHTAWTKRRQVKKSVLHKRASYLKKKGNIEIEEGFMSEIIGFSLTGDEQRVRGKAPELVIFEEAGKCRNFLDVWDVMLSSVDEGDISVGQLIAFGTGGTEDADILGLETIFREPKGYQIMQVENIWEENAQNTVGYFSPYYMNLPGFMDEDGNSLIDKAKEFSDKERDVKIRESKNPMTYSKHCAERPHTPQEALLRVSGAIFPAVDINDRLAELETNQMLIKSIYTGVFKLTAEGRGVEWKNDTTIKPIMDFPYRGLNKEGGFMIFEHPVYEQGNHIPHGRYVAGTDPYAQNMGESLGSTFVMNRLTERIVAEYTGRPATDQDYYEQVRRLLMYYNAMSNYENNIKGMFYYFEKVDCLHLLAPTPKVIEDKVYDRQVLNRKYGTPGTEPINEFARNLIKSYLNKSISKGGLTNLFTIRSIPLLKELKAWTKDGNYDRVSALGMTLIQKAEMDRYNLSDAVETEETERKRLEFFYRK